MNTDGCRAKQGLPAPPSVKVHTRLCFNLQNLVDIVSEIIPEIEAARPGALGVEALCQLYKLIHKAKSLLQHCRELSILLLVLAGDTILSRCKMLKHQIKQSLSEIQRTVPVALAAKISRVILAVKGVVFCLDSSEKEAKRVLCDLLYTHRIGLTDKLALSAIHAVCSTLKISSPKAIRTEQISIRRLMDKFGGGGKTKRKKVLIFFQNLLKKYRELEQGIECPLDAAQTGLLSWPEPPKEFLCPLSMRLMHDPVVIASGLTYDRASIQQWFDEGHDTCPETNEKLDHFMLIANAVMKDIISKWCSHHHVCSTTTTYDRNNKGKVARLWTLMSVNTIGSLASCIDDLNLQ